MSSTILTVSKTLDDLPISEIARYMGARQSAVDGELLLRINELLPKFISALQCKVCYAVVPIAINGADIELDLFSVRSKHLSKCLQGCTRAIIFAATIGIEADRLRRVASVTSPLNHLIYDAMGTAAIECFCDLLCNNWAEEYELYKLCPRFSPGYGDLKLDTQIDLLRALDAQRKIGLTLSDSMLMIPQKSVTAIVGMKPCD